METVIKEQGTAVGGGDPFAALTQELTDLGYVGGEVIDGIITYACPDGDGILATIDHARPEARLSRRNGDGDPTWMLRFTGDMPPAVQLITLYVVLHADTDDETRIVRSLVDSRNVPIEAV